MAVRKLAPAAQKTRLRKSHGQKKKMFHAWPTAIRISLAKCGVLTKYHDFESFQVFCASRGIRANIDELYAKFVLCKTRQAQDEYFANIREHAKQIAAANAKRAAAIKKCLALAEKVVA